MSAVLKYAASAIAVLACAAIASAYAQTPAAALSGEAQAHYQEDEKCLGVYMFMAVAERAVPPANMRLYLGLIKADGAAAGRTDDQIKTDSQTAVMAYMDTIKTQSKDNTVPPNAGWDDYQACNTYFAGRGIVATPPVAPRPKTGQGAPASQP